MPLREDLLNPINGDNPSGDNLRYDPIYDKIKEARRHDDELEQGIWTREIKRADYSQVIQLASDALATRSKDLQIVAWLTEALAYKEGLGGLCDSLVLARNLLETFWDTLHPELEDGDPFMRTGILDWIGSRLDDAVKTSPLTKGGLNWYQYKESRAVGSEEDCGGDSDKLEARNTAIEEGKIPAEEFDKDFNRTPKAFYAGLQEQVEATLEALRALEELTDARFTEEPPSFSGLRSSIEDLQQTVHVLLATKREQEPDIGPETGPEPEPETEIIEETAAEPQAAEPRPVRRPAAAVSLDPADRDDAIARVVRAAAFWRQDDAYSPVPYLMLRGLRWGELRAGGTEVDQALLEAPPSEIRQGIKRKSVNGEWEAVLETAETAMGMPCGRGWLDVQRYVVRACSELGSWHDPIARAVTSELRALLADYPSLPDMTLMDDTPTANRETQEWLAQLATPAPKSAPPAEPTPFTEPYDGEATPELGVPPDAYDLAQQAAVAGRPNEAMEILSRELTQAKSGRERFQRRTQLAQICLASGREIIAYPILQDLAAEIEKRRLNEWETPERLVHPLVLLHRCMTALNRPAEERQAVYERICRLDPVQAMSCG